MSAAASSTVSLPVRFYLQLKHHGSESFSTPSSGKGGISNQFLEGQTHALSCTPTMTFAEIKQKIWAKKALPASESSQYCFKLAQGEVTFEDEDTFARFLEMNEIFREDKEEPHPVGGPTASTGASKDSTRMLECVLLHHDHLESRYVREKRSPTQYGVIVFKGHMHHKADALLGTSWKQRYYVLQDMTLFAFENEEAAMRNLTQNAAVQNWSLGSLVAIKVDNSHNEKEKAHPYCFELRKSFPPGSQTPAGSDESNGANHPPSSWLFYPESEQSLNSWIYHVNRLYLRRLKFICVHVTEELDSRGLDASQGLFRVSGSKAHVDMMQAEYDAGKLPNLGLIADEHILTSFLKSNLRNMPEPLLTYGLYPDFIKVMFSYPLHHSEPEIVLKRLEALKALTEKLPHSNQGLLEYLMSFLYRVSESSAANLMTTSNLSIVFAPNILRPRVENVNSVIQESKAVQDCVEALIKFCRDLWPNYSNTRRASKLTFYHAVKDKSAKPELAPISENAPAPAAAAPAPAAATPGSSPPPPLPGPGRVTSPPTPPTGGAKPPPPPLPRQGTLPPPLPPGAGASTPGSTPGSATSPPGYLSGSPPSTASPLLGASSAFPTSPPPSAFPVSPQQSEEWAALTEQARSLANSWADALNVLNKNFVSAVKLLAQNPPANAEVAPTVTRTLNSLTGEFKKFESQYTNLVSIVTDAQAKQSQQPAAATAAAPASASADSNSIAGASSNPRPSAMAQMRPGGVMGNNLALAAAAAAAAAQAKSANRTAPPPLPPSAAGAAGGGAAPPGANKGPPPLPASAAGAAHSTSPPGPPARPPQPPAPAPAPAPAAADSSASASSGTGSPGSESPIPPPPPPSSGTTLAGQTLSVLFDYEGGNDSMSLKQGEKIYLLEADEQEPDWWLGRKENGQEGYFPASFVWQKK